MTNIISRFLRYVEFDTQSDENSMTTPSTATQFKLAEFIKNELLAIGICDVTLTDKCYLYAKIPATSGYENVPSLGFIAHLDTSSAASGANVKAQVIENWDGKPIALGDSGRTLLPKAAFKGHTIITTDGTTLLGGDDKAGIAIIVSAVEEIIRKKLPHGPLNIAFTPDEEIGRGADFFDVEYFGASYAYTVDGGETEVIEGENFNAASAEISFRGVSIHPGYAKNVMINAQKLAMEFDSMLPAWEVPAHTEDREGFYHLVSSRGDVSTAQLQYILRDHDSVIFEKRKDTILDIAAYLNKKYRPGSVTVNIKDSYRNMAEIIDKYPFLIDRAKAAISAAGYKPAHTAIRGGTDGARLCFMGLPCPNLGYGGFNAHGETEYVDAEGMKAVVGIVLHIIDSFADNDK